MASEHPIGTRKHKLSTAKNPCPKKAPSIDIANPTNVKQNTEAIFKIALKKFSHQEHLKHDQTFKNDKKLLKDKKEPSISTSAQSRLVFDGISKEEPTEGRGDKEDEDSQRSLEFAADIESDSITTGAAAVPSLEEDAEEYETDPERQAQLQAIANRLGEIGDEFQSNNQQVDDNFQQELLTCAVSITSQELYQTFETTIDSFLHNRHQSMQDAGDQYKVALVLLCTQKAISLATEPVEAASREADRLINYAANFVANRFPSWLGGAL